MGWIRDEMQRASQRANSLPRWARPIVTRPLVPSGRRPLHAGDVGGWLAAAEQREPPRKRDRDTLRAFLMAKNPRRWRALQRELRWAEKEMLKLGLNPEDTRWLL